jgi:L-lysine exporter family protein LysE/ArgO
MLVFPTFASGFMLDAALIVAIGAQNLFVLRQGLRQEHVGPVVLFCAAADTVLVALGVMGLGTLLKALPALATVLTLGGALFLFVYGAGALRRAMRPEAMTASDGQGTLTLGSTMARVAGFTLLNPHVYLDTVLLMGSVGASQPGPLRAVFVAGAASASLLWFAGLGYGARLLTPLFARPAAWRVLDGIVAATMFVLAIALVRSALA